MKGKYKNNVKKNLIIIAIIGSAVFCSANAFGQNNKRKAKPKPLIGDILDGVGIRKKPTNKRNVKPKPVIGDILDGVGIRRKPTNKTKRNPAKGLVTSMDGKGSDAVLSKKPKTKN